jgi:1,4-dihydroxy-6-naphthoate synthase
MGWGCGPIVVAKKKYDFQEVAQEEMAIPGRLTTANLLLTLHGVHCGQRIELRYDRILSSVASGEVGAGCLIHEGRFVYHTYGLHKILDLGKWWEQSQRLPLPLGVIVLHRRWDDDFVCWIEDTIRKSIEYSDKHTKQVWPFIKQCAQEMDDTTITEHISAYVNEYSYYLGQQGRKALETMLNLQELRELA